MEAKKIKSLHMNRLGCPEQDMSESNDFEDSKQYTAVAKEFTPRTT